MGEFAVDTQRNEKNVIIRSSKSRPNQLHCSAAHTETPDILKLHGTELTSV